MKYRSRLRVLLTVIIATAFAGRASAQSSPGVRTFVFSDSTAMAASQTFDAVLGTSRFTAIGVGGEVTRIPRGLFFRAAGTTTVKDAGTRVVVFGDEAVSLGIPLNVEMRHLEFAAGWRFHDTGSRRVVPYLGGGLVLLHYVEASEFADITDNTDQTFNGGLVFAGIDVTLWKWLMAGAEVQVRTIPNAIGTAGASAAFKEDDLGGATVRLLVGIRR